MKTSLLSNMMATIFFICFVVLSVLGKSLIAMQFVGAACFMKLNAIHSGH